MSVKQRRAGWNLAQGTTTLAADITDLLSYVGCVVIWEYVTAQNKKFVVIVSFLPNNAFRSQRSVCQERSRTALMQDFSLVARGQGAKYAL